MMDDSLHPRWLIEPNPKMEIAIVLNKINYEAHLSWI